MAERPVSGRANTDGVAPGTRPIGPGGDSIREGGSGRRGGRSRTAAGALELPGVPLVGADPRRDVATDALRGFSILLVVLGHAIANAENLQVAPDYSSYLVVSKFLYTFHMPLFFLISGYVLFGRRIRVSDRALRLLPPFIAWIPVYWLVNHYIHHWPAGLWSSAWDTILHPAIGLWFLPTLFLCSVLLVPVRHLERKGSGAVWLSLLAIFLVVNLIPVDILGLMQVKYFFPFFAAGYMVARYRPGIDRLREGQVNLALLGGSVLFLLLFVLLYHLGRIEPYEFPFTLFDLFHTPVEYIIRYGMAALGILFSAAVLRAAGSGRTRTAFAWLGLVTMDIYVSHFIMLQVTAGAGWLEVLVSVVTGLALSLALSLLVLRQWSVTALLFLGLRRGLFAGATKAAAGTRGTGRA